MIENNLFSQAPDNKQMANLSKKKKVVNYLSEASFWLLIPPTGLLSLPLCDELPQPDGYFSSSGHCQEGAGQVLLNSLGWGRTTVFISHLVLSWRARPLTPQPPPHQIRQRHPSVKVKYLSSYCFSGVYILTLLTDGYNFTSEIYSSISYIKQVCSLPTAVFRILRSTAPCPIPK